MRRWPVLRPTFSCGGLVLLGCAIFYAGASQSNNGAFLLGFVIASVVLMSAARTWTNTRALTVRIDSPRPVFAGQEVTLPFEALNGGRRAIHAFQVVAVGGKRGRAVWIPQVERGNSFRGTVTYAAPGRGVHRVARLEVTSRYPLGFFAAAMRVASGPTVTVYPQPSGDPNLPRHEERALGNLVETHSHAGDDFAGVRPYVLGESQRHIDWKAAARGAPLMIKHFSGDAGDRMMFDFDQLLSLPLEARLSQLALWLLRAEKGGHFYGLRLPHLEVEIGHGERHLTRCLTALAEAPGGRR